MKVATKRKMVVWIGLAAIIAISLVFFKGLGTKMAKPENPARAVLSGVQTAVLQPSDVMDFNETSGTVKAKTISILAAKIMGVVTDVRVRQGEQVKAGQVLLSIDADDVRRQVEAAAYQRELAEATSERYRVLYSEQAVARQQLDEVETRRKVAEAEYARAAANLAFARITSPIDGVVTDKRIDPGSMASPGTHLLTVEDISAFNIETQADERLIRHIVVGMPVEVVIESLGRTVSGKVVEASPSVDPVSHTFYVKVEMLDSSLRSGLYAKVRFPLARRQALVVPSESLVYKGQLSGVYVVSEQGVLNYRLVKTGKKSGAGMEILSGLSAGERIVVQGTASAVDGGQLSEVKAP